MRVFAIIGAIGLAAMGAFKGYNLATVPPFDYAKASPQERQTWLDQQAESFGSGVKRGMPRGSNGISFKFDRIEANAGRKEVRAYIEVKVQSNYRVTINMDKARKRTICSHFVKTQMYREKINVEMTFVEIRKKRERKIYSATFTPGSCDRVLAAA